MPVDVYARFFFRADDYGKAGPNSRVGREDERSATVRAIRAVANAEWWSAPRRHAREVQQCTQVPSEINHHDRRI